MGISTVDSLPVLDASLHSYLKSVMFAGSHKDVSSLICLTLPLRTGARACPRRYPYGCAVCCVSEPPQATDSGSSLGNSAGTEIRVNSDQDFT